MKKFDKKIQIKVVKIILIIIWMITVFRFSNQGGTESSSTSAKVTKVIVDVVVNDKKEENKVQIANKIEKVVRKFAHYTIYTIGGVLIMNYAYTTDKTKKQQTFGSLLFGVFYAATDEVHQYFVPGRSARVFDVGIDTLGVITGIGIYLLVACVVRKMKKCLKTKIVGGIKNEYESKEE